MHINLVCKTQVESIFFIISFLSYEINNKLQQVLFLTGCQSVSVKTSIYLSNIGSFEKIVPPKIEVAF